MDARSTGHYVTTTVAGESVQAFVPDPLPPRLSAAELEGLTESLRRAEAALAQLDLAGAMIPSLDWFVYAFVRKEALLSSEIEGPRPRSRTCCPGSRRLNRAPPASRTSKRSPTT